MLDFLSSVVPIKYKRSEELISQDIHSGTSQYKFTFSTEIVPICKDDLVVLPKKLAKSMGNTSQLVLCSKITNTLQFIDCNTLQISDLAANVFWRNPFTTLADVTQLVEFIVLDVEPTNLRRGKWLLADITVARASDMGVNDQEYYVRSHLGGILHPGDSAMGFYLANSNFNSDLFDKLDTSKIPDVILVKKHYARSNKRVKNRQWKLKRMANEHKDIVAEEVADTKQARQEQERAERDYELFLEQLEEDEELRQGVNLYKSENAGQVAAGDDDEMDDEEDDAPQINVDELLDELDEMNLGD
ncbi:unnamed protein product [Ambrosiozyma monospora]|uniref:Unnamed protein product n=1 Tax=Ambrosiozyma monospora TaxID=43982 RepID=A0ACB5T1S7_AMBMO|nr:unnamed protein product [Ambrosiozyma monospora]